MRNQRKIVSHKIHVIEGEGYEQWLGFRTPKGEEAKETVEANPDSLEESLAYYAVNNLEVIDRVRKVLRKLAIVLTVKQKVVFDAVVVENKSLRDVAKEKDLSYSSAHERWEQCKVKFKYYYKRFQ